MALFLVWSFEEGREKALDDGTNEEEWARDGWSRFFSMRTSRLILLRPGDIAVLAPGAFHRVFTLETKVVTYQTLKRTLPRALPPHYRRPERIV